MKPFKRTIEDGVVSYTPKKEITSAKELRKYFVSIGSDLNKLQRKGIINDSYKLSDGTPESVYEKLQSESSHVKEREYEIMDRKLERMESNKSLREMEKKNNWKKDYFDAYKGGLEMALDPIGLIVPMVCYNKSKFLKVNEEEMVSIGCHGLENVINSFEEISESRSGRKYEMAKKRGTKRCLGATVLGIATGAAIGIATGGASAIASLAADTGWHSYRISRDELKDRKRNYGCVS